jgi:hypothetical protein
VISRMMLAQQQRFFGVLLIISLVLLGLTLIVVLRGTSIRHDSWKLQALR